MVRTESGTKCGGLQAGAGLVMGLLRRVDLCHHNAHLLHHCKPILSWTTMAKMFVAGIWYDAGFGSGPGYAFCNIYGPGRITKFQHPHYHGCAMLSSCIDISLKRIATTQKSTITPTNRWQVLLREWRVPHCEHGLHVLLLPPDRLVVREGVEGMLAMVTAGAAVAW